MPEQVPRSLDVVTTIDFQDGDSHYLQSWKSQLIFEEGEITNLHGDLGISNCRPGKYEIHLDELASQLSLKPKEDVFYRFYKASRLEE